MSDYRIPLTYVGTDGVIVTETEDAWIPPVVGQGWISKSGVRFRIVDVWVNSEKRGVMGSYGVYAFVEPAAGADDRPGELYPSYYRP